MKEAILEALYAKYEGQVQEALVNTEIYLMNPCGIGEHSEILEAIDIQISKLAEAKEKQAALKIFV